MQFQVPQFIEAEDKIVGPLTIRQFIYLAVGGGISFLSYAVHLETWLWLVISVFAVSAAVAFAFAKVNGRPLHFLLLSVAGFLWRPHTYVWQPEKSALPKNGATMSSVGHGISLEQILSGRALKSAWESVQTGAVKKRSRSSDRYTIFRRPAGDRNIARRVDYR